MSKVDEWMWDLKNKKARGKTTLSFTRNIAFTVLIKYLFTMRMRESS